MFNQESSGETGLKLFRTVIEYKNRWNSAGYSTPLVDLLTGRFKRLLGGRVVIMFAGGAPLSAETQAFTRATFGVLFGQAWALTECTGAGTLSSFNDQSNGRAGAPLWSTKVRLYDWSEGGYTASDRPNPRGELLLGGPCIASGYFKRQLETEEVFFEEDGECVNHPELLIQPNMTRYSLAMYG